MTKKSKYALKALACLARAPQREPLLIADIAEREDIPRKFLELILRELKQHGFVQSRKGRGGGYLLAQDPEKVTLASVLRVLEGPIAPVPCLSRNSYERCGGCRDERTCGVRLIMKDVYEASVRALEKTTLADMLRRIEQAERLPPSAVRYSI